MEEILKILASKGPFYESFANEEELCWDYPQAGGTADMIYPFPVTSIRGDGGGPDVDWWIPGWSGHYLIAWRNRSEMP